MKLSIVKLGLVEYRTVLDLQLRIQKLVQGGVIGNTLLLLEHPPVITLGRNGNKNNILVSDKILRSEGIKVCESTRCCDVSYHGPGQVVGYPIINLNYLGRDVRDYINRLEWVFIRLLKKEYGIVSNRIHGSTGVWIGNDKITELGCSVKRWVTMHGFAFNVNTNLEHFKLIQSSISSYKGITSLQKQLDEPQHMETVMNLVIKHFADAFHMEPELVKLEAFLKNR